MQAYRSVLFLHFIFRPAVFIFVFLRAATLLQANAMLRAKKLLARYTALMTAHNKKPGLPRAVLLGGNVYGVKELQYDGPTVQRWLDDVQEEAVQHIRAAFDTEASFGIGSCGSVFMPKDEYFKGKRTRLCLEDRGDHIFLMLDATFCINFVYPPESASSSNRVPATPPASSSDDEALTASPKVQACLSCARCLRAWLSVRY